MKNLFYIIVVFLCSVGILYGQETSSEVKGLQFTDNIVLPATPVKNQYRTSTCWSFSALSFLESEMLRQKKPVTDLSEMFVIFHTYCEKASKYVRMQGHNNFAGGGEFHDVINTLKTNGIVPEEVYSGLNYGEEKHIHNEMDQVLKEEVDAIIQNPNRKLSPVWFESVKATLKAYLGEIPEKFNYQGTSYTPHSFARDYVGLNLDDYVEITSFTHHPFYTSFLFEFPDNWSWGSAWNVPLNEMEEIIDYSLKKGYTVAWAADMSEKGFIATSRGIAFVPGRKIENMSPEERSRWEKLTDKEKDDELYDLTKPIEEMEITQEMRQIAFDNYQTTDDHGMHIIGTATDQTGKTWYKVKNSWGDSGSFKGYFYASKPYVNYKTTCLMVHKEGIPTAIRKKLGF